MPKIVRVNQIKGRVDFALITIREDEFEAALRRFSPYVPVIGSKQDYQYCLIKLPRRRPIAVAIVRAIDQGQSIAQSVARKTIDELNPRWLILTGIAGGLADHEFSLGDVLLANTIHDFSVTAAYESGRMQLRPTGGPVHRAVEKLLANLPASRDKLGTWNTKVTLGCLKPSIVIPDDLNEKCYYGDDETKEKVRNSLRMHFPTSGDVRPPRFKIGAVATSNMLVKDTAVVKEWQKYARQITHIDMEAGGVYIAARDGEPQEIPLLCVRGISDIVGFSRTPEWTHFACESVASFVYALITELPPESFDTNPQAQFPFAIRQLMNISWNAISTIAIHGKAFFTAKRLAAPSIEAIVNAFINSSKPLLARVVSPDDRIPREEQDKLDDFIHKGKSRVICLLGAPGSGKTSLLALLAKTAVDSGTVTLAIKADILPSDMPFDTWGNRELNLDISAFDAVRVAASRSKVLVIVDQLDALASTVDLTSDRLNQVLDFIEQCSALPQVSVICSCREFDFNHDTRFSSLQSDFIKLELPSWEQVMVQLEKHGVKDASGWPQPFQELLRTPQHLQIYLDRFATTGNTDTFGSYHLMLDDLWVRNIQTNAERDFIYRLTEYLIEREALWAPLVQFEEDGQLIDVLESKQILQRQDHQVGFRHQTLLEHAKARLFTKSNKSFCSYVLDQGRQDSILVRPTVWAVLRYLRDADRNKYRTELDLFFKNTLRLHLRYLLIEFLGQIEKPEDYEIVLLAERLVSQEDRIRALIAIRGRSTWFHALRASHLPIVMQGPLELQWPMLGVITDAWDFDRDACLTLIESNWLPVPTKDQLTWRAMAEIGKWDNRAIEIVRILIRRADKTGERLFWAESLVSAISAEQPELAPSIFIEAVSRGSLDE